MRHETTRVTSSMLAYISFERVEFMQDPKTEQTALQAAVPAQHARLPMLRRPPIAHNDNSMGLGRNKTYKWKSLCSFLSWN